MNATDNYLGLTIRYCPYVLGQQYIRSRVIYEHALLYYIYFTTMRYYMVVLLVYFIIYIYMYI